MCVSIYPLMRNLILVIKTYLTENPSAGPIVQNFKPTLLPGIKSNPTLVLEIVDDPLQKSSTCHLTRAAMIDMGNRTVYMSVRYNGEYDRERPTRNTQLIQAQGA